MAITTQEFAHRLAQALESCPHAPEAEYGRLTWLQRELESRANLKVSVNSVHKWVKGMSRPRPDNIREIARILGVDEVWLAMGQKPAASADSKAVQSHKSTGAVMTLAGLIEQNGGRVTFPATDEATPHLYVNIGAERFGLIVVVPQIAGDEVSFIVPEPAKDHRVVGVVTVMGGKDLTFTTSVFDLTTAPKQTFGGFSVVQFDRDNKGALRAKGETKAVKPINSILELA